MMTMLLQIKEKLKYWPRQN